MKPLTRTCQSSLDPTFPNIFKSQRVANLYFIHFDFPSSDCIFSGLLVTSSPTHPPTNLTFHSTHVTVPSPLRHVFGFLFCYGILITFSAILFGTPSYITQSIFTHQ
ncbi:hypothetical protein GALMADRAFT_907751 [Galerina marginata CBS 339.88]|uniref:Uncharacterized protein n=1 Tax=Galerina marginata (strain CBS 339.88) TaxID=685588 RepID=A0A067SIA6_GALM3|nr:hypothetical protein GALMADRAFT_907751 [Galerina marginata CBS 339.88]